ncbi:MAG: hypothetical protein J7K26_02310 [Candidatus Aenigmarchaeota archaeon]|nr:hypothetical protein [Candidatus Aenigmarchaeota archaeon]
MKKPKKKPWLAGLLSFFIVGMGQIYNREYEKGIVMFFLIVILWSAFYNDYSLWSLVFLIGLWTYSIYDAEKVAKETIYKEPDKRAISITVGLYLIIIIGSFIAGLLVGWVTVYTEETQNSVIEEYNLHILTINNDSEDWSKAVDEWSDVYEDATSDNYLVAQEVTNVGIATESYVYQHKLFKKHISNFRYFILENEDSLKQIYGNKEIFNIKKSLDDYDILLDQTLDLMKQRTQDLRNAHQEYNEQLLRYLKILALL